MAPSTTQIIKQSICFRAKYGVDRNSVTGQAQKKVISPLSVVPHPKNRGGDPVKSLRTMQLTGTIIVEGYDPVEANSNGVAVEEKPAVAGGSGTVFQDGFAAKINTDPDMLDRATGNVAIAASLSHSHLNCCMRNILGGKKGCECQDLTKCDCASRPILDQGNYSMEKLTNYDVAWANDCHSGLQWEMLAWKMDEEEPDAALIISIALNKKNEAAMKTGHLEIMSTLVSLCKPNPDGVVAFEPVRDKLIELYGTAVDHPDFVHAFKMVCDAGGDSSVHMKDLHDFTSVYVNPKLRKMRMEAYATVSGYPLEFPRIKNACIKWAWKQTPSKGWCQLPPSISHRLSAESKYGMHDLLVDVEAAMLVLSKLASTVVEEQKSRTKWIAEVDINLIAKVFAVPKTAEGKTVQQQEAQLREECATLIANKLFDLVDSKASTADLATIHQIPSESNLMQMVQEQLAKSDFKRVTAASAKKEPVVTETLLPKVIQMDADGRPMSQHETMFAKKKQEVETIPWVPWAEKQARRNDNNMAKMVVMLAMGMLHDHATTPKPIALVRKGGAIQALATQSIEAGELVVPLFFKKQNSMFTADDGVTAHPKAVCATVSWAVTPTVEEKDAGIEGEGVKRVAVHVQPELKLPTKGDKDLDWTSSDAVHPYWFIKRTDKDESEANAHLIHQDVTHVMACSFKPLASEVANLAPATDTFSVALPCIVNMKKIEAGSEVILKWKPLPEKRKATEAETNAFEQIAQQDKKQRKAKAKAAAK